MNYTIKRFETIKTDAVKITSADKSNVCMFINYMFRYKLCKYSYATARQVKEMAYCDTVM